MSGSRNHWQTTHTRDHTGPDVLIVGLKHVGKSSVAQSVAERVRGVYRDLDDELVALANGPPERLAPSARPYDSARAVYSTLGAENFARLETRALESLLATSPGGPRRIISTGGGLADNQEARTLVDRVAGSASYLVVYLSGDPAILYERIRVGGLPAFLDSRRPRKQFLEIAARRHLHYARMADITIAAGTKTSAEVADLVVRTIG